METRHFSIPDDVDAPITLELTQHLNAIHADFETASPERKTATAINGLYAFASDVLAAIYKLETGRDGDTTLSGDTSEPQ